MAGHPSLSLTKSNIRCAARNTNSARGGIVGGRSPRSAVDRRISHDFVLSVGAACMQPLNRSPKKAGPAGNDRKKPNIS